MKLLYWIYPYSTIYIIRDVSVAGFSQKYLLPDGVISSIASFPLAYVLSSGGQNDCGLIDLFKFCTEDEDEEVSIPIIISSCFYNESKKVRPFAWPCNISDDENGVAMVLGTGHIIDDSKIGNHHLSINR